MCPVTWSGFIPAYYWLLGLDSSAPDSEVNREWKEITFIAASVLLFGLLDVKCAYVHVMIVLLYNCNHAVVWWYHRPASVGSGPGYTNHHKGKSDTTIRGKQAWVISQFWKKDNPIMLIPILHHTVGWIRRVFHFILFFYNFCRWLCAAPEHITFYDSSLVIPKNNKTR